ncbi:DUF3800 domain-containing protein [Poriferisphaera sp. WC338]|uniref:DUF3800 domain-containing protein n=1 Tax=Poriferisphaera sp. WC338 TaxID=3425129 RepID=UPI003D81C10C
MSTNATVFCDESGNSGPNYLDNNQPFYVLAGWLVKDADIEAVNNYIASFKNEHFPQRKELKASAILRNEHSKQICASFFNKLNELKCLPIYLVAEKRYCVAGKIVETFIDPTYNDIVNDAFTNDVQTKQEIANTLYNTLSDKTIALFAQAYRQPTADGLKEALEHVERVIESEVSPELSKLIGGCKSHIADIANAEAEISDLGEVFATLNTPCLVNFLMQMEYLGRIGHVNSLTLIHDQQHTYQEGYEKIYELHRRMPRIFTLHPQSNLIYSNLEHVTKFEMMDSKSSPLIQAADLLAGAIHHCFKSACKSKMPTKADSELAATFTPIMLFDELPLFWLLCSNKLTKQLIQNIVKPAYCCIEPSISKSEAAENTQQILAPLFPENKKTLHQRMINLNFR